MKFFIMSIVLSLSLFAGGDILPVDPISKFEKMDDSFVNDYVDNRDIENSFKPILVDNCITTCGEPATILAYYGEDIPLASTEPCLAEDSVAKSHLSQY